MSSSETVAKAKLLAKTLSFDEWLKGLEKIIGTPCPEEKIEAMKLKHQVWSSPLAKVMHEDENR
jgi:hypothetical protein